MKKMSDVFKSIRFAKMDPKHDKPEVGGSKDDEEHYTVNTKEWDQQVKHVKKRAMQEEKKDKYDEGEYDREGDMAKSDLRSIIANAKRLHDMIEDSANLPEWVQSKITIAEDYISTVTNYMTAEMNEAFKMPSETVAEKMARSHTERRKKSGLPDPSHYLKISAQKKKEIEDMKKEEVKSYVPSSHATPVPKKPKSEYENKVVKYLKKKYNKEEVELDESVLKTVKRITQGWGHDPIGVGSKPKDIVNRNKSYDIDTAKKIHSTLGDAKPHTPAGLQKKVLDRKLKKEEVGLQEGRPSQRHPLEGHEYHKKSDEALIHIAKDAHAAAEAMKGHNTQAENKYRDQANDSATVRYFRQKSGMPDWYKKKYGHVKEDVESLEEKNVPTSPEKWAQAKAQAKAKFDVYPSAYANGWAAKKYKAMGGGWKSVSEESILESRKAEIIKKIVKGKKNNNDDKFEPNPVMSKDEDKGRDNINNK